MLRKDAQTYLKIYKNTYIKKRLSFNETKLRNYNAVIKLEILYAVACLNLSSVEKIKQTQKSRKKNFDENFKTSKIEKRWGKRSKDKS